MTPGPVRARRAVSMAAWGGSLWLFGGVGGRGTESILDVGSDLWRLDPDPPRWTPLGTGENAPWPSPRRCPGFAPAEEGVFLWGGSGVGLDPAGRPSHTFLNDLWLFRPEAGRWERLEPSEDYKEAATDSPQLRPEPRYTPVWHVDKAGGLLFSGYTEDRLGRRRLNDLWLWRGLAAQAWERVAQPPGSGGDWPGPRYGAMSAADEGGVYVCGGSAAGADLMDLWRWSFRARAWQSLCPEARGGPAPRYAAAAAFHDGGFWIFGGRSRLDPKTGFSDTWRFDVAERRWELVHGQAAEHSYDPGARHIAYHAKSASATIGAKWFLWGGEGLRGHVSDLWCFDLERGEWRMLQPARPDDPSFW